MKHLLLLFVFLFVTISLPAQVTERERPAEWEQLVPGARFIDRFLPMQGEKLSSDTWGAPGVLPRYTDNGIEDRIWSYWGGNIRKGEDGKYHLMVCGWLESSAKGHGEWPNSYVFNAVSDRLSGPYKARNLIGKGHNPELYRLKDGRYVLYVIKGRYVADDLNGKWEYGQFDFNARDRAVIEGLSNLSFAQREDGSFLMVCRGGGIWVSRDGLSEYGQLTDKRVYPDVDGRFEDPVLWRDHVQYHLIVNDWLGRIAFYLRSKDGLHWVTDDGEAYMPGIAVHEDGRSEEWFKYERLKVYQDKYGRAIQANFAVIDTLKAMDKPYDRHSSKNICIPLDPGLLLTVLNEKPVTARTKTIRVKVKAEEGFNPQTDMDIGSLRFGASREVNYGRGGKVVRTENEDDNLILTFDGKESGITEEEFAPKLIGKRSNGKMLYGYARLPYVDYIEPMLSARAPRLTEAGTGRVEVQNFGQTDSKKASLKIEVREEDRWMKMATATVPPLHPYEKRDITFPCKRSVETGQEFRVTILSGNRILSTFNGKF